jgi:hypothetical protein
VGGQNAELLSKLAVHLVTTGLQRINFETIYDKILVSHPFRLSFAVNAVPVMVPSKQTNVACHTAAFVIIFSLFHDAVSSSDHTPFNNRMINE